jgi:endonuclease YncB( thermonuclease family)
MRLLLLTFTLVFCTCLQAPARASAQPELKGVIIGVADGDTVTLLTEDKRQIRIRLARIDAPEKRQPYGAKAKQILSSLCFGKNAEAAQVDTDRYGRMVARLHVDGLDINAEMVRLGAAWVYRKYAKDQAVLALESEARAAKRGIWSLPEADRVPPWEWRNSPPYPSAPSVITVEPGSLPCGPKRTCRQMSSCAEARFYLTSCGVSSLDGDHDGVPCETLCR